MAERQFSLTSEQQEIVDAGGGLIRVIACPGSGKTEVMSQRIVKLVRDGAVPRTIVAFTFTEKAARELKFRVRALLEELAPEKSDTGDMFVGTIHSFCYRILKEIRPEYRSYDILDDAKRVAFLAKRDIYYGKVGLVRLENERSMGYYQTIYTFVQSADVMMNEEIDPEKLTDRCFRECYRNYLEVLDKEKYFDFSSVIHCMVMLLRKDPAAKAELGRRVRHLVVDEYQDINKLQGSLVELLSENAESVCVVGDDDQNIYGWRGSDDALLRKFGGSPPKGRRIRDFRLSINFRSTKELILTSQSLIMHNRERLAKKMRPNPGLLRPFEQGDIIINYFGTEEEEEAFIREKIGELHGSDFIDKKNMPYSLSYRDMAVLVRTNSDGDRIVRMLTQADIPCVSANASGAFQTDEVILAMNCLAYVFGCGSYPDHDAEPPSLRRLRSLYLNVFASRFSGRANPARFEAELRKLKNDVSKITAKGKNDYLGDLGLQAYYHRILSAMGAGLFEFDDVMNYNLAAVSRAISDYESVWVRLRAKEVKYFFAFVHAFAKNNYSDTQFSNPSLIDAVNVMTIHKAKGLEFPVVFVPRFIKRHPPPRRRLFVDDGLYDTELYGGTEEDERKVYYTAMTRSEKYLFMTGSVEGKKRRGEHPFAGEISRRFVSQAVPLRRKKSGLPSRTGPGDLIETSYSELSSYDRCGHDFKLRHVYQYNAGVPAAFGYGTNIHNVLNYIHSSYMATGRVPSDREIDEFVDRIFTMRYATKPMADRMKQSAKAVVRNYVALYNDNFRRILETEKGFEFTVGKALISGRIDLLLKADEKGEIREVEVIDFKTDRGDAVYVPDYKTQLRLYTIACRESLGLRPQRAVIHHLDTGSKEEVDISNEALHSTRERIKENVSGAYRVRKFRPKPNPAVCSECDYRVICPYRKKASGGSAG